LINDTSPSIPGDTGWYDSGTSVSANFNAAWDEVAGQSRMGAVGYSLNGGPEYLLASPPTGTFVINMTLSSPENIEIDGVTQYHVTFVFTDYSGSVVIAPSGFGVDVNGHDANISAADSWFDSGTTVNVTRVAWDGGEVPTVGSPSLHVTAPEDLKVQTGIYEASLKVTDVFGLPLSGVDVFVVFANGTTTTTVTAADGVAELGLVPAGTYQASVSNLGITTKATANPALAPQALVRLPISYSLIGVIVLVVVICGAALVALRRGGHSRLLRRRGAESDDERRVDA
jgi:hypothetical protein